MDTAIKEAPLGAAWNRLSTALHGAAGAYRLSNGAVGMVQKSGAMTMVPLFGVEHAGFVAPGKGIRLQRVHTYGDVELGCPAEAGSPGDLAIVPLHIGFIQHGAQNHALCSSALIEPGKTKRFTDARCVQAAQGGYLEGRDQWFFVLPLGLRGTALEQIGQVGYSNLWNAIAKLNTEFDLPERGHLEQLLTKQRPVLNQYRSRFECLPGQTGALFFVEDRLVGIEITPNAAYFRDVWPALASFAYGIAAHAAERKNGGDIYGVGEAFAGVETLANVRRALAETRAEQTDLVATRMNAAAAALGEAKRTAAMAHKETGTLLETVKTTGFGGQVVTRDGNLVYASLFRNK